MWDRNNPEDFSRFQPSDILPFLDWFEAEYQGAVALGVADAFVEGLTQPYLGAIASGQSLPLWLETVLRWRLVAQWAYQRGYPIQRRIDRDMAALFPPDELSELANRFRITPQDVADLPPAIRQAFIEGAGFSLQWVKRLSDDARMAMGDILAVQTLKNRNPLDAVPILERLLRRDLVARELGLDPSSVTPEMVERWTLDAESKVINAIAHRAKAIAQAESMRMMNLGILTGLEQDGHRAAYVMPHAGSCEDCRRLIDGRVFLIRVLKENLFKNFGTKRQFWVASLPQHPFCRHSAMVVPVKFRDALKGRVIPPQGIVLEWFGLPSGESAMAALELVKPDEGWLLPSGAIA
jgi:hypothetical protein